jgi:hypothetical protein
MSPSPSCPNRGAHKGIQERRKNNDVAVLAGSGAEATKSEPCQWPRTARTSRTDRAVTVEFKIMSGVTLEERDLTKALDELLKPTDPPEGAAVKNTTQTPSPILLESILPRLPPKGQAWLNGLNPFCRRAVEHDLRFAGPDLFVQYWESLRDTLQKLERDFGPSDNWK